MKTSKCYSNKKLTSHVGLSNTSLWYYFYSFSLSLRGFIIDGCLSATSHPLELKTTKYKNVSLIFQRIIGMP